MALSTSFTDPGIHDDHTATIDWGDSTTTNGTVTETPGSGDVTGTHTYAARGTYTVKVTVNDKDGGKTSKTTTVVVSAPPTASAGGPYTGTEGTPKVLAGTASDPDGDPLAISWTITLDRRSRHHVHRDQHGHAHAVDHVRRQRGRDRDAAR